MARTTFAAQVGDLERKAAFVDEHRSHLSRMKGLDPRAAGREVSGISETDADQEALKGQNVELTAEARGILRRGLAAGAALVLELRAAIARSGRNALLAALPRLSRAQTLDGQIGGLQALLAFVKKNADVAGRLAKADIDSVRKAVSSTVAARSQSAGSRKSQRTVTRDLKDRLRLASVRLTAWLDIFQGLYTLLGEEALLAKVHAVREGARKGARGTKATPAQAATPTV